MTDTERPATRTLTPVADGFLFGEGPRWHDHRLWFSDMLAHRVYSLAADHSLVEELEIPCPSGLGFLPDGSLLVAARAHRTPEGELLRSAQLVRWDGREQEVLVEFPDERTNLNDMVVSPDGLAYLNLYVREAADDRMTDQIALVRPGGDAEIVATGLSAPNGMAVTGDGTTLIVSEMYADRILAFTIRPDGSLSDHRIFADGIPTPDGLCLDRDGAVWVGSYSTGEFLRVGPTGTIVDRVAVVAPQWAVAPVFGGEDRRTLYLITNETTVEEYLEGRSTGRLFQIDDLEVGGAGTP